ncbi:MAG: DNA polymerase III subunit epsilon [Parvularculaceae bacterium]
MRQIVFDLETTGFRFDEGHRIVEIGAVELMRGAVTGKNFHAYVNPERDMPDGAYQVHGLSADFLKDFPTFADAAVAPAFLEFLGEAELIAHNGAAFDLPFLNAELEAAGFNALQNSLKDTLLMARRMSPGSPASLDALCARFGVDRQERDRDGHGALLDSKLLAAVYIELTGGAQAGLDFTSEEERAVAEGRVKYVAPQRPTPLASFVTDEEKAAHDAFVAEIGENAIWLKHHNAS